MNRVEFIQQLRSDVDRFEEKHIEDYPELTELTPAEWWEQFCLFCENFNNSTSD